jgi:MFS family permease
VGGPVKAWTNGPWLPNALTAQALPREAPERGLVADQQEGRLWAPPYRALTAGLVLTVTMVAAEALAVVTVMPVVARDLGGLALYGWVFSAFMLGNVIGIVTAGRVADRRGPAVPFVAGVTVFGAGLAMAGLAPSMPVLVAGRAVQGIGAGAVPAVAYVAIGRQLPGPLRARMMALMSSAWVIPALAGPVLSAAVARAAGWRWVFLGLLPLVAVTAPIAVPSLARLGRPPPGAGGEHRLVDGVAAAAGTGLLLAGLTAVARPAGMATAAGGAAAMVAGAAVAWLALRRLLPPGTLAARPGLPATIAARGLLAFAFFGADAYVTLTIAVLRHRGTTAAGLAVTAATLAWTAGSWAQARLGAARWEGRRLVRTGLLIVLAGIGGMVLVTLPAVPPAAGVAAWAVAGLGMGLGYAPVSLLMLREAPPGREGWASAALSLADVLGAATGIGAGGAAVAATAGPSLRWGITAAFGISAAVAVAAVAATRRLPAGLVGAPRDPAGPRAPGR